MPLSHNEKAERAGREEKCKKLLMFRQFVF
jgi:hypothetical protein